MVLVRFILYLYLLIVSNKNRNFQGKIINLWLLYSCIFYLRRCQIPPAGYLQIKYAALHIIKTQLFLTALIVINIVKFFL
jgi:hypothetical protein